jgi:hypothetical protein
MNQTFAPKKKKQHQQQQNVPHLVSCHARCLARRRTAVERTDNKRCMQEAPEGKQNQDNR